jgi:Fe-S cluster assembly protein SufD
MSDQAHAEFVADFGRRAAGLPGGGTPWVERMRRLALEQFAASGFPSRREEDWKYTNVEPLARHRFEAPARPAAVSAQQVAALGFGPGTAEHLLVFVDGHFVPELSRQEILPRGASVASLAQVLTREPARVEPYLADAAPAGAVAALDSAFVALNTAFAAEGAFVHVPRGVALETPIRLLYLGASADAVMHPRTIVVLEDGAEASVLEHYAGPDGTVYFSNAVTQAVLGANSSLRHYKLQQEGDQAYHVAAIDVRQGRDSRFVSHSLALGGALARTDIGVRLEASGCSCALNGLYLAGGSQLTDHHTRIDHLQPQGRSREFYRGILDGRARGVFAGSVVVHEGAQKTDAHLANHNLLLSRGAEADTKPQLEIYADDVKCGHGATVGQLDEEMLFYLRSRGIAADLAGALLTYAFAGDVVGRIELAPLRARMEDILIARLPEGRLIREHA